MQYVKIMFPKMIKEHLDILKQIQNLTRLFYKDHKSDSPSLLGQNTMCINVDYITYKL